MSEDPKTTVRFTDLERAADALKAFSQEAPVLLVEAVRDTFLPLLDELDRLRRGLLPTSMPMDLIIAREGDRLHEVRVSFTYADGQRGVTPSLVADVRALAEAYRKAAATSPSAVSVGILQGAALDLDRILDARECREPGGALATAGPAGAEELVDQDGRLVVALREGDKVALQTIPFAHELQRLPLADAVGRRIVRTASDGKSLLIVLDAGRYLFFRAPTWSDDEGRYDASIEESDIAIDWTASGHYNSGEDEGIFAPELVKAGLLPKDAIDQHRKKCEAKLEEARLLEQARAEEWEGTPGTPSRRFVSDGLEVKGGEGYSLRALAEAELRGQPWAPSLADENSLGRPTSDHT